MGAGCCSPRYGDLKRAKTEFWRSELEATLGLLTDSAFVRSR